MLPALTSLWQNHRAPLLCLLAGLLAGVAFSWYQAAAPKLPLSPKQERQARAAAVASQQAAYRDTARAARADSAAAHLIRQATLTRYATHSLPTRRLPISPAATANLADSLTRFLAGY